MLRQSKKTDKELMVKYLNLAGAKIGSYKLRGRSDTYMYHYLYQSHKVGTRQEQIKTINKINNFDGIAVINVYFRGNERVEDHVFPNTIDIHWDKTIEARRIKRLRR